MMLIFNDISFSIPFINQYDANDAIVNFAHLLQSLKEKKVSKVDTLNIKVPYSINSETVMSCNYTLGSAIRALHEGDGNRELISFLLSMLTKQGIEEDEQQSPFLYVGKESKICAKYKDEFFLSVISDPNFKDNSLIGSINGKQTEIKNISNIENISFYWKELGFREYERNEKHKMKEGFQNGVVVSKAPETDQKGQNLLNDAIEVDNKLYSIDMEDGDKIYEFRNHHSNKFHGFLNNEISSDMRKKIIKISKDKSSQ